MRYPIAELTSDVIFNAAEHLTPDLAKEWHLSLMPAFKKKLELMRNKNGSLEHEERLRDNGSLNAQIGRLGKDIQRAEQAIKHLLYFWPEPDLKNIVDDTRTPEMDPAQYRFICLQLDTVDTLPNEPLKLIRCEGAEPDNQSLLLYKGEHGYYLTPNMPYNQPNQRSVAHWPRAYTEKDALAST
jgi:hypothetical protein